MLRTRGIHPFNPQGFWSGPWGLSLNTASSFVSNTTGPTHLGQTIRHGTPAMHAAGLHGANLQDKEQRFGTAGSALFVAAGTASGAGAVNSGVEAFTGLGSAVAMSNIMTGEVIFGGPGSGLFGMLLLVVLAVFIAGLMVGRTPEYLGKKLGAREVKLAALGTLFVPVRVATSARTESPSRTSPAAW